MPLLKPTIVEVAARDSCDREHLPVRKIVLHATVQKDPAIGGPGSLNWLKGNPEGTSIHVLIQKNGLCYHMVPDERGANHVGFSRMVVNGVTYAKGQRYNCNQ